jgi:hypothetical protein
MSFLRIASIALFVALAGMSPAAAAGPDAAEMQRKIQEQQRHIDSLEQTIEDLESQLMGLQQGQPSINPTRGLDDPLVGTWQCTNNVFTYDMTFFADGRLLQETPTFGKFREGTWRRAGDDEVILRDGTRLRTSFRSEDRMTAEKVPNQSQTSWSCEKSKR